VFAPRWRELIGEVRGMGYVGHLIVLREDAVEVYPEEIH